MLAIKKVPIDTDLQEIIKEITIMQQCDSPYVSVIPLMSFFITIYYIF